MEIEEGDVKADRRENNTKKEKKSQAVAYNWHCKCQIKGLPCFPNVPPRIARYTRYWEVQGLVCWLQL